MASVACHKTVAWVAYHSSNRRDLAPAAGAVVDRYRALSTTSAALAGWVE